MMMHMVTLWMVTLWMVTRIMVYIVQTGDMVMDIMIITATVITHGSGTGNDRRLCGQMSAVFICITGNGHKAKYYENGNKPSYHNASEHID